MRQHVDFDDGRERVTSTTGVSAARRCLFCFFNIVGGESCIHSVECTHKARCLARGERASAVEAIKKMRKANSPSNAPLVPVL